LQVHRAVAAEHRRSLAASITVISTARHREDNQDKYAGAVKHGRSLPQLTDSRGGLVHDVVHALRDRRLGRAAAHPVRVGRRLETREDGFGPPGRFAALQRRPASVLSSAPAGRMRRMRVLALIVTLAWIASPNPVRADVAEPPTPDQAACIGKQVGDACEGGGCVMARCSRPGWELQPDGRRTATQHEYDCMRCVAGAPVAGGVDDGGTVRLVIGLGLALAILAGGVWLARRKRPA
jgi:hypothetical protein